MNQVMDKETSNMILDAAREIQRARIFEGSTQRPMTVQKLTLDLTTAVLETRPYKIGFPFKSIYVQTASDVYVSVDVKLQTSDSLQSSFPMKLNDSFINEFPISEAYLSWSAQSGKSITFIFFIESEYRSGSQISVTGGGVSINDGSTITGPTRVTLTAATAGIIAPADTLRKTATLYNDSGADIFIGDSTVTNAGATKGIPWPNGTLIYFRNTGVLYGYSVAGGNVIRNEEK